MATPSAQVQRHFIHAGEHHVTREPIIVSTLLGSCVAVCLYDPVARVMGMNHFLLPMRRPGGRELSLAADAGRYGHCAMELLIRGLLGLGARREDLCAKAFGGGNVLNNHQNLQNLPERYNIGSANVAFVQRFLEQSGIPLLAHDLGGDAGRHISFYGGDYSVYLRRIPSSAVAPIVTEEQAYLQRALSTSRLGRQGAASS